ncbi:MAG: type 2 isopentenyl-diphosphate Delta-isomerase [Candidatus Bathyarchaeota archaeon]|nr:MAG: type 2 isopentenyl-diphosphate Delta-isomerase [Candidatus Bathyarchaeota archaeon]
MTGIERRKERHLRLSLEENVQADIGTGFEDVRLIHRALPEIDLEEVSMEIELFGKRLVSPLIVSAITGGTEFAKGVNSTLASVVEEHGLGIGVGSQRIALEEPSVEHTFSIVRENAPSSLVMGNIGCPQLSMGWGVEEARRCIDMIQADALAIHMNPLQEAVQVGGEARYRGVLGKVEKLVRELEVPIVMKETGCGIAREDAMNLEAAGVEGLEVSGVGGTSWAAVEHHVARVEGKRDQEAIGEALWNWGIPTAISVMETSASTDLKIIASGGMRTGVEMAKAIALGADAVGIAGPFLEKAVQGRDALREHIENILLEFRTVMFLVGARDIEELKRARAIILGRTAEWLRLRGFEPKEYAMRKI